MSYIPGTEANRVSRAEHGQDPNTYSSGSTNTGEAFCSFLVHFLRHLNLLCILHMICIMGFHSMQYCMLRKLEALRKGTVPPLLPTKRHSAFVAFAGGGVASYIPGTEANRISRAEHGQDSNYGTGNNQGYSSSGNQGYGSGNQGYGSGNQGYGSGSGNTGGGVASYIPGTEANRISRAEHGQNPNTYSSGNQGMPEPKS